MAPSPGSIPSTADMSGMGTGTGTGTVTGTSEAAQVAVARRISSNQRHIERLKLARSHQAEKEAALKVKREGGCSFCALFAKSRVHGREGEPGVVARPA